VGPVSAVDPVSIVLAVDGGGSKTDVAAIGLNGEVVAHARGEGSSPQRLGWPTVRPLLDGLRAQVLREAGDRAILATHVYLCGLDLPEELAEARSQLAHWQVEGTADRLDAVRQRYLDRSDGRAAPPLKRLTVAAFDQLVQHTDDVIQRAAHGVPCRRRCSMRQPQARS
jgi:hypothetical protein